MSMPRRHRISAALPLAAALALAVALVLGVAACGKSSDEDGKSATPSGPAPSASG